MPIRTNGERLRKLRAKAELLRDAKEGPARQADFKDVDELIEELELHQIELEMTNEELERARAEVAVSSERYFSLYDLAPVGYLTLSTDGVIKEGNLAAARMLGQSRSALAERKLSSFVHPDYLSRLDVAWREALRSEEVCSFEIRPQREPDRWIHITLDVELSDKENGDFVRLILSDQTDRKKADDKVRLLNRRLHQYSIKLREANEELKAFSYSVSHDLKAPLRAVRGFGDFLVEEYGDQLDDQARDYINRIRDAGTHMQQLIDSLLHLSRIGRSELKRTEVDLGALAREVASELKRANPDQAAEFLIADTEYVDGDGGLLRIVLQNLLSNALKYSSHRQPARIEFGETSIDNERVFFVVDNGVGFDQDHVDRLFQPFGRLHSADDFAGDGIGLATVRRIINHHGGRVWAEGRPNEGAHFYFTLPHPEDDMEPRQ